MKLNKLNITHFRNIEQASLLFSDGFNVFYGDNGSGKTSVLEAIYFLAMAKSFRSHLGRYIVRDGQEALAVFAQAQARGEAGAGEMLSLGISKSRRGSVQMKRGGEEVATQGEWVRHLPVLLCNHDTYQLLDAGPKVRRQFVDWGVFHVKHDFFSVWQAVQRILRQRNAALRNATMDASLWDTQLVSAAQHMTALREAFLADWIPVFHTILAQFIHLDDLQVEFLPGWSGELSDALRESLYRDKQQGFTRVGPHRADVKFMVDGKPAHEVLSRGQQKVFVTAMKLAQGEMVKGCLYLFDDLPSELDEERQGKVVDWLQRLGSQVLITGISPEGLAPVLATSELRRFHVKHGAVQAV